MENLIEPTKYVAAYKGGKVYNGFDRDRGRVYHAIKSGSWYSPALCGSRCGQTSYGWTEEEERAVTCPKCLKKLNN